MALPLFHADAQSAVFFSTPPRGEAEFKSHGLSKFAYFAAPRKSMNIPGCGE
jgi:hypothetical protein